MSILEKEKYTAYEIMNMILDRYQEATYSCFIRLDDDSYVSINELREKFQDKEFKIKSLKEE